MAYTTYKNGDDWGMVQMTLLLTTLDDSLWIEVGVRACNVQNSPIFVSPKQKPVEDGIPQNADRDPVGNSIGN